MLTSQNQFSPPVTNLADCVEVVGQQLAVYPSNVAVLALESFRKDFPELAARLESMRANVCGGRMPSEAACAAAGGPRVVTPPSNTGVNKTLSLALGSK